ARRPRPPVRRRGRAAHSRRWCSYGRTGPGGRRAPGRPGYEGTSRPGYRPLSRPAEPLRLSLCQASAGHFAGLVASSSGPASYVVGRIGGTWIGSDGSGRPGSVGVGNGRGGRGGSVGTGCPPGPVGSGAGLPPEPPFGPGPAVGGGPGCWVGPVGVSGVAP